VFRKTVTAESDYNAALDIVGPQKHFGLSSATSFEQCPVNNWHFEESIQM